MHEYLDLAAGTGYFDDVRVLYDLTPAEIAATIAGRAARDRALQQAENVRVGTICASIYNQHRQKKSDRVLSWKDFFPDTSPKPAQSVDTMKAMCKEITLMYGGKVVKNES